MGILKPGKIKFKISLLCLIIILSCGYIILTVNNIIWRKNVKDIASYTYLLGTAIKETCQRDISLLTELSKKMDASDISNNAESLKLISEFALDYGFEYIAVVDLKGKGITNSGQQVSLTDTWQLKEVLGNAGISGSVQLSWENDNILLHVPIKSGSEISGAIISTCCKDNITGVLSRGTYFEYGCIIDSKGNMVLKPGHDGIRVDNIYLLFTVSDNNIDKIKLLTESIKSKQSGTLTFKNSGEKYILSFTPLDINDWYFASVVPVTAAMKDTSLIIANQIGFCAFLLIIFMGISLDINNSQKSYLKQVEKLAYNDLLTGQRNYTKFVIDANKLLSIAQNKKFAAVYFDIANFKYINDVFGYETGDRLLCHIADTLVSLLEKNGIFSRINADKFVALFPYSKKSEVAEFIVLLLNRITAFSELNEHNYKFKVYAGIFCSENTENMNITAMIDRANIAQKSIKHSNIPYAYYSNELREAILREKEIENQMESALQDGEFIVHLQPKYEIRSNKIVSAEALVRWQSPEKGLLSPKEFISIFEKNRFIIRLDTYVFEKVCEVLRNWIDKGYEIIPISVNVSPIQFYETDFVPKYSEIKERYQIPDEYIELEFTESIFFENPEILTKVLEELKTHGFICSIDDFGSGYSSLNMIKDLPVDVLKLDGLFFRKGINGDRDKAVIKSVITMAKELTMKTVAEGVETKEQLNFLNLIGCDMVQGFVYSKPLPVEDFEQLLWGEKLAQFCC